MVAPVAMTAKLIVVLCYNSLHFFFGFLLVRPPAEECVHVCVYGMCYAIPADFDTRAIGLRTAGLSDLRNRSAWMMNRMAYI